MFSSFRTNTGFGLVELTVVSGVLLTLSLGILEVVTMSSKHFKSNRVIASRDDLKNLAEKYLIDPRAIRNTIGHIPFSNNHLLDQCIKGPGGTRCGDAGETTAGMEFSLFSPVGDSLISGVYRQDGSRCAPGFPLSTNCPIQLITYFKAQCAGGAATCDIADTIELSYSILGHDSLKPPLRVISNTNPLVITPIAVTGLIGGITDAIVKWSGPSMFSSSTMFEKGGLVGVGTATPMVTLDVRGQTIVGNETELYSAMNIRGSTVEGGQIVLNATADGAWGERSDSWSLDNHIGGLFRIFYGSKFFGNEQLALGISSNGNVGVGKLGGPTRLSIKGDGTGEGNLGHGFCGGDYTGLSLNGLTGSCAIYNILSSPTDQNLYVNRPVGKGILFREGNVDQVVIQPATGNLGVGTSAPIVKLDVAGSAKIDGSLGVGVVAPQTRLDVAGGIKMGDEATCDTAREGTQRYNSTLKIMEFCDGTSWNSIGGKPTPPTIQIGWETVIDMDPAAGVVTKSVAGEWDFCALYATSVDNCLRDCVCTVYESGPRKWKISAQGERVIAGPNIFGNIAVSCFARCFKFV